MELAMENVRQIRQRAVQVDTVEDLRAKDRELIRLQGDEIGRLKAQIRRLEEVIERQVAAKAAATG